MYRLRTLNCRFEENGGLTNRSSQLFLGRISAIIPVLQIAITVFCMVWLHVATKQYTLGHSALPLTKKRKAALIILRLIAPHISKLFRIEWWCKQYLS